MNSLLKWFTDEESGQGMVEYGLILALIACVVVTLLTNIGTGLQGKFQQVVTTLTGKAGT